MARNNIRPHRADARKDAVARAAGGADGAGRRRQRRAPAARLVRFAPGGPGADGGAANVKHREPIAPSMTMRIGMIGDGNVGSALTRGLTEAGYDVRAVGKEPRKVKEIGQWAETLCLAVPFQERENALRELGDVQGKILVDVTNALAQDASLAVDPRRESGAEQLQRMAPGARVVKAFNTVFAQNMDTGSVHGERLTAFVAGDDEAAKQRVVEMARAIGFDALDAGPLQNARWLETLGLLNIALGYGVGLGPSTGFRYVHAQATATGQTSTPRTQAHRTA